MTTIKELNKKITKLDQYLLDHPLGVRTEDECNIAEAMDIDIQRTKYDLNIRKTCSRCSAHLTRQGDFLVSYGEPISKEKAFARICKFTKENPNPDRPCINDCLSISDSQQKEFGYGIISQSELEDAIVSESIKITLEKTLYNS